jgi:hypothetical protein
MKEEIEKLQSFIANNYDLEKLEARLNEFNTLKVLKIAHHEIRHSNILSWLLHSSENHNLGDQFLKKFLSEVILKNENINTKLTVFDIQMMKFADIEVLREWNNVDICIISPSNKIVAFIENKINASESKGQLKKYFEIIQSTYKGFEIIPIYLTLENDLPSDANYGTISYSQVLDILRFVNSINRENLNSKVYDFINHYIETLEVLTMGNVEIKDLCKKIYSKHKEAIELIFQYSDESEFGDAAKEFVQGIGANEIDRDPAWFVPKEFNNCFKKIGDDNWCNGYPFAFWFMKRTEKLGIIIEIGPFIDESKRRDFLNHLKDYNFKIYDKSFKVGGKYTRIFTKYPKFQDWDNKEEIIKTMDNLYKMANEPAKNLLNACKSFSW